VAWRERIAAGEAVAQRRTSPLLAWMLKRSRLDGMAGAPRRAAAHATAQGLGSERRATFEIRARILLPVIIRRCAGFARISRIAFVTSQ
jgi:hypothetical protein